MKDDSDHEDPCAHLIIPADNQNQIAPEYDDEDDGVYPQNNNYKKYLVEVTDNDKIEELMEVKEQSDNIFG